MTDVNVLKYLREQTRTNTECAAEWIEMESLYNEKLWTQLTEKTISLINHPALRNEDSLVQLYQRFISSFAAKMDPHNLVDIVSVIVSFMGDKNQAIELLESIEDTVKVCNDALWHCYVIKGEIQLNHFNDLNATKKIIDTLSSVLGNANQVPVYWKMFLLTTNYRHRVGNQLEQKFTSDMDRLKKENIKFNSEIEKLTEESSKRRESFDNKLFLLKTEIEAKFTSEAIRNFEEVINSQTEISSLRKLNGRLLVECSQLRGQKSGLEAKLEAIITEQQQQKQALLLLGAHLEKINIQK